jgi:hypothetical protein
MGASSHFVAVIRATTAVATLTLVLGTVGVHAQCATAAVTNFSVTSPVNEKGTATIGWRFTPVACCPSLNVYINNVRDPVDGFFTGTRDYPYDLTCVRPGTYIFSGQAGWQSHLCGVASTKRYASVTVGVNQEVMVSLRRLPQTGKLEATIKYNFPPTGPRNVALYLASWRDELGALHPGGSAIGTHLPANPTGEWVVEFAPPSTAQWVQVRATGSRCSDVSEAFSGIDCPTCTAQAGDPVSMLDGTVRYDDADGLPCPGSLDWSALI